MTFKLIKTYIYSVILIVTLVYAAPHVFTGSLSRGAPDAEADDRTVRMSVYEFAEAEINANVPIDSGIFKITQADFRPTNLSFVIQTERRNADMPMDLFSILSEDRLTCDKISPELLMMSLDLDVSYILHDGFGATPFRIDIPRGSCFGRTHFTRKSQDAIRGMERLLSSQT